MRTANIIDHFGSMPDPREDNRRHKLIEILFIVICAAVCGAEKWADIEAFGKAKESWLRKYLELPHGIPSHDTFARVFAKLDPQALNERFSQWVQALYEQCAGEIISIDGKTARRSHDAANDRSALHMVSAWASKAGLTLAQRRVDEKSNEITAIPELLEVLEFSGCVVTIDAMGTQKSIAKRIIDGEGEYVLALKGNHPTLEDEVELYFADELTRDTERESDKNEDSENEIDYYKSVDTGHGRVEVRECWASGDIEWLPGKQEWKGLRSICAVRSKRIIGERESEEVRYFISSLPPVADTVGRAVRAHWGIENSLHWVLDMAFREDECRKRKDNSAENFAVLRHLTLNLLKREKTCKRSIAGKRLLAGWDERYMEKVLFGP